MEPEMNVNVEPNVNAPADGGSAPEPSVQVTEPARQSLPENALLIPGETATEEERKAFESRLRKHLGVPDAPEGYQLEVPEGIDPKDPVLQAFVSEAHAQGMSPGQVQSVMAKVLGSITEIRQAQELVASETSKAQLQELWRDKFDTNLASAITGMEGVGKDAGLSPEKIKEIARVLPQSADFVRMFAIVGRYYSEDKFIGGGIPAQEPERTPSGHPMLKYESGFGGSKSR